MSQLNFYQKLSDSERRYVAFAAVFFPLFLIAIGFYLFASSIDEVDKEVGTLKDSLKIIRIAGPQYLASQQEEEDSGQETKKVDDETLKKNSIKLTSFISGIAKSVDVNVATYDENDLPYDSGDKSRVIIERTLTFEVREVELSKLMALMAKVEASPEPVVVTSFSLTKYGSTPGKVRAKVVVATFLLTEKGA